MNVEFYYVPITDADDSKFHGKICMWDKKKHTVKYVYEIMSSTYENLMNIKKTSIKMLNECYSHISFFGKKRTVKEIVKIISGIEKSHQ